jgi:hypothetical protein
MLKFQFGKVISKEWDARAKHYGYAGYYHFVYQIKFQKALDGFAAINIKPGNTFIVERF